MDPTRRLPRRRLLTGISGVAVVPALSGCADDGPADGDDDPDEGDDDPDEGDDGSADDDGDGTTEPADANDGSEPATGDDPDRREANVVDVAFEESDGGMYAVDVTLHHDDDGEEGYANWWQVERLDGSRLGRRDLLHAHSQQPFTRSETIEIPADVACVVVRGHDETHGYGGMAVLVDLDSGATHSVDQGSEPRSFDVSDCP